MFNRIIAFLYGVACYLAFLAAFLYAIGFIGNFLVPKSIDSGMQMSFMNALAINAALLGLFAVQHSVMARQWFKRAWGRIVPTSVERSTYVLFSSLALLLLFWKWQPMGGVVWDLESGLGRAALYSLYAAGWAIVLATTFLINHFDFFGLAQVYAYLRGKAYQPPGFKTPLFYRYVRHPMMTGQANVMSTRIRSTSPPTEVAGPPVARRGASNANESRMNRADAAAVASEYQP